MDVYEPWKGKLEKIIEECPDIKTFHIKLPQKIIYQPGQFAEIGVFGIGEAPFSITGGDGRSIEVTVKKIGNVTTALHNLKEGDTVFVRGPFGNGYPLKEIEGRDILFLAGGIGIANLKASIEYCLQNKGKYGRLELLYGVNIPSEIAYSKQLKEWGKKLGLCIATVWYPDEKWKGEEGLVTAKIQRSESKDGVAFVCGPSPMLEPVIEELGKLGMEENSIYVSLERMMKCGVGKCGHCSLGDKFICKDGPVFSFKEYRRLTGE